MAVLKTHHTSNNPGAVRFGEKPHFAATLSQISHVQAFGQTKAQVSGCMLPFQLTSWHKPACFVSGDCMGTSILYIHDHFRYLLHYRMHRNGNYNITSLSTSRLVRQRSDFLLGQGRCGLPCALLTGNVTRMDILVSSTFLLSKSKHVGQQAQPLNHRSTTFQAATTSSSVSSLLTASSCSPISLTSSDSKAAGPRQN